MRRTAELYKVRESVKDLQVVAGKICTRMRKGLK